MKLSVAVIVNVNVPAVVGVPLNVADCAPLEVGASPGGKIPADTVKLTGGVPPLLVTVALYAAPAVPFGSVAVVIASGAGAMVTVKPFVRVAVSAPVTVTFLAPVTAAGSMFSTAMAFVAEVTVSEKTVIPAPKLAVVDPWTKCVDTPVIATDRFCCPCAPVFGLTEAIAGGSGFVLTVKPFGRIATSVFVVIVTLRAAVADGRTAR